MCGNPYGLTRYRYHSYCIYFCIVEVALKRQSNTKELMGMNMIRQHTCQHVLFKNQDFQENFNR